MCGSAGAKHAAVDGLRFLLQVGSIRARCAHVIRIRELVAVHLAKFPRERSLFGLQSSPLGIGVQLSLLRWSQA